MPLGEMAAWASLALSTILAVVLIVQTIRISRIERRYRLLLKGSSAGSAAMSLGEIISAHAMRLEVTRADIEGLRRAVDSLDTSVARSIQFVGLVRYNPFQETGGDQSFSLALLDKRGDGVVMSSLHSRTSTRFYAKPVKAGASALSLSTEEEQALKQAVERTTQAAAS